MYAPGDKNLCCFSLSFKFRNIWNGFWFVNDYVLLYSNEYGMLLHMENIDDFMVIYGSFGECYKLWYIIERMDILWHKNASVTGSNKLRSYDEVANIPIILLVLDFSFNR